VRRITEGPDGWYLEWEIGQGGLRRTWIKHGVDGHGHPVRHLHVAKIDAFDMEPGGSSTDFQIISHLSDEQILKAFVLSVCVITGCKLPFAD
jgi:hypothetical protein